MTSSGWSRRQPLPTPSPPGHKLSQPSRAVIPQTSAERLGSGNCCQAPLMPLLEASLFPGGGASPPICQPLPHPEPLSDLFAVKSQFCPLVKSHKSPLPGSCRHSSRALRRGGTQKLQGETPAGGAEGAPSELRGSWTLPRRRVTRGRQGTAARQTPVDVHPWAAQFAPFVRSWASPERDTGLARGEASALTPAEGGAGCGCTWRRSRPLGCAGGAPVDGSFRVCVTPCTSACRPGAWGQARRDPSSWHLRGRPTALAPKQRRKGVGPRASPGNSPRVSEDSENPKGRIRKEKTSR